MVRNFQGSNQLPSVAKVKERRTTILALEFLQWKNGTFSKYSGILGFTGVTQWLHTVKHLEGKCFRLLFFSWDPSEHWRGHWMGDGNIVHLCHFDINEMQNVNRLINECSGNQVPSAFLGFQHQILVPQRLQWILFGYLKCSYWLSTASQDAQNLPWCG